MGCVIKTGQIMRLVQDADCPKCGYPELILVVKATKKGIRKLRLECPKCTAIGLFEEGDKKGGLK